MNKLYNSIILSIFLSNILQNMAYTIPAHNLPSDIPAEIRKKASLPNSKFTFEQITNTVFDIYRGASNEIDMYLEMAKDFVKVNFRDRNEYSLEEIEKKLAESSLRDHSERWRKRLYDDLLKIYGVELNTDDTEFLDEIYGNPEKFGLIYDAYKIMIFEVNVADEIREYEQRFGKKYVHKKGNYIESDANKKIIGEEVIIRQDGFKADGQVTREITPGVGQIVIERVVVKENDNSEL